MKFFRIIVINIVVLFMADLMFASVLKQVDINGVAENIGDFGQFNNEMSFNVNPVSVGNTKNSAVKLGYIRFFNGLKYNLNAFSLVGVYDFKYLQTGLNVSYFRDTDSIINYNEFNFNLAFASDYFIKKYVNLKIGVGLNFSMENMDINYNENLISGNSYNNSEFDLSVGVIYYIRNLKFSIGFKNLLTSQYFFGGIGYQFSKISVVGVSVKYKENNTKISLGLVNNIIDNVLNLYIGVNPDEFTTGIEFRIFDNLVNSGNMFFNYTLNYNFALKDSHYMSIKYEF